MKKYSFPPGFHVSSLAERKRFYSRFQVEKVKAWLKFHKKPVFAVDIGSDTGVFKKEHRHLYNKMLYIHNFKWNSLRKKMLHYLPEDLYYDRNLVKDFSVCERCKSKHNCMHCKNMIVQELAIDLDPENIKCSCKNTRLFSFCEICLEKVKLETIRLHDFLKKEYEFRKMKVVFSGRGYHIHVFDKKPFYWTGKQRRKFSSQLLKQGFPIDPWVINGGIKLIRQPYSLNGLVNKMCLPIPLKELKRFNPMKDKRIINN